MKRIISLLAMIITINLFAQDVRHTQIFSVPLKYNPALMCASPNMSFLLNHRMEYFMLENGFMTSSFTFFMPFMIQNNGNKLNLGICTINDMYGAFQHINASLHIGYNLRLTKNGHFLSAALSGAFNQKQLTLDNLSFDDQYILGYYKPTLSSAEIISNEKVMYPDLGFGVLWHYADRADTGISCFAGAAAYHIIQPNEAFINNDTSNIALKIITLIGMKFKAEKNLFIAPTFMAVNQKNLNEFSIGLNMEYIMNKNFTSKFGLWYRITKNFAFIIGLKFKNYSLTYSYDFSTPPMNNVFYNMNIHEISLGFNIKKIETTESILFR